MTTGTNKPLNMQDSFLNRVRSEKKTIVVYLLNGFQVRGRGWGFDNYLEEANTGTGIKMSRKFKYYFQILLPVLIVIILVQGLI